MFFSLQDELQYIGINQSDFAKKLGVHRSKVSKKIYGTSEFTSDEIRQWGSVLEQLGGDPTKVWPEYIRYKAQSVGTIYDGSLKNETGKKNIIPLLAEAQKYIKNYTGEYAGKELAIKSVELEKVIYRELYYILLPGKELIKRLDRGSQPDTIIIYDSDCKQEIYKADVLEIYSILGYVAKI